MDGLFQSATFYRRQSRSALDCSMGCNAEAYEPDYQSVEAQIRRSFRNTPRALLERSHRQSTQAAAIKRSHRPDGDVETGFAKDVAGPRTQSILSSAWTFTARFTGGGI